MSQMTGILVVTLDLSGPREPYFPRHLVPQCVPCPYCEVPAGAWCRSATTGVWNTVPFHAARRRKVADWTDDQGRAALAWLREERERTQSDVREVLLTHVAPKVPG